MVKIDKNRLTAVITRCHEELDEFFLLQQEALVQAKLEAALELLGCYTDLHQLHMDFENEQLIPELTKLGDPGQWSASLYSSEHDKVHELLQKAERRLRSLHAARLSDRETTRGIIILLDEQKTLKGVCEHHQEREQVGLLPELDKLADTDWLTGVITPFLEEWEQRMKHNINIAKQLEF